MEVKQKYPKFLRIVTIIGFVVIGLYLMGHAGALTGPTSQEEIDLLKENLGKMMSIMPKESSYMLSDYMNLIEVQESNYVRMKLIPFVALFIAFIGNLLIRRRRLIGMHLIIAGIIAGFASELSLMGSHNLGLLMVIMQHLLLFVYAVMVVFNRKYLA